MPLVYKLKHDFEKLDVTKSAATTSTPTTVAVSSN